ncbi:hypothetical protein A9K97_gp129 [Tokyovirus A1]|uniref:hypothetical protein n=1 Tax=Tokyovirus A1 TaxID=1826170 RepID=UPI0007A95F68|nr:hypothetical protein A9K97_gp129 [Tokyovirus A1]BAU80222.1 hypothetical protein [Tokyovirus A1]
MDELPLEISCLVFSFLSIREKTALSLTCQTLNSALHNPCSWENVAVPDRLRLLKGNTIERLKKYKSAKEKHAELSFIPFLQSPLDLGDDEVEMLCNLAELKKQKSPSAFARICTSKFGEIPEFLL